VALTVLSKTFPITGGKSYVGTTRPATGGGSGSPVVRPAPGTFANVSLNTLQSVAPASWPSGDSGGPFANWTGAVLATDYSTRGALVNHGSGHLSEGTPLWAGVNIFDFDTSMWVMSNVPSQPIIQRYPEINAYVDLHGESLVAATLGHTTPPHTYDGVIYRRASGGKPKGSMLRLSFAGASYTQSAHEFDIASATAPAVRVIDTLPGGNSYPMSAVNEAGTGFWYLTGNGTGPMAFYDFATFSKTVITGADFNEYGNYSMTLIPGARSCLVATGNSGAGGVDFGVYVCPLVSGVPSVWTKITPTGTPPSDKRCGSVWSTILNCLVSYEAAGSYKVHRLTPPATGSLTTGTWAWTSETLTGVGGISPARTTSPADNGSWSRFIEAPTIGCFIWVDSVAGPVQAWTLQGM
jgi:hypothetical protein